MVPVWSGGRHWFSSVLQLCKFLARREDFTIARMAGPARRQLVTSHSFALNSLAKLGRTSERLRPAPQTKSRTSLRASRGYAGPRSLAIPTAPFPLHPRRPGTQPRSVCCGSAALCSSRLCGSLGIPYWLETAKITKHSLRSQGAFRMPSRD